MKVIGLEQKRFMHPLTPPFSLLFGAPGTPGHPSPLGLGLWQAEF